MSGPIGDERNQFAPASWGRNEFVKNIADGLDDREIGLLAASSDIIFFSDFAARQYCHERAHVVVDVEPIPAMLAVTIYRQGLTLDRVENHERDQFFREMIGTIIIRAVRNQCWKA